MTAVLVIQGPGLGPEGQRLLAGLAGMAGFQQVQPSTETALRAALAARRPAVLLMAANGRIMGVAGIVGGLMGEARRELPWRLAFVAGMAAPGVALARPA